MPFILYLFEKLTNSKTLIVVYVGELLYKIRRSCSKLKKRFKKISQDSRFKLIYGLMIMNMPITEKKM